MSSGNNAPKDPAPSSPAIGPADLELGSLPKEYLNDERTGSEENGDSNFLIEAVYHAKNGKTVVPETKQQDQLRNK